MVICSDTVYLSLLVFCSLAHAVYLRGKLSHCQDNGQKKPILLPIKVTIPYVWGQSEAIKRILFPFDMQMVIRFC